MRPHITSKCTKLIPRYIKLTNVCEILVFICDSNNQVLWSKSSIHHYQQWVKSYTVDNNFVWQQKPKRSSATAEEPRNVRYLWGHPRSIRNFPLVVISSGSTGWHQKWHRLVIKMAVPQHTLMSCWFSNAAILAPVFSAWHTENWAFSCEAISLSNISWIHHNTAFDVNILQRPQLQQQPRSI